MAGANGDRAADHARVAIIGAGFSGIGMAIRLLADGIDDFYVLERADDLGGTWRDNTYPGLSVRHPVGALLVLVRAEPRLEPGSTRCRRRSATTCSGSRDERGVVPHIRFGHEVHGRRLGRRREAAGGCRPPRAS